MNVEKVKRFYIEPRWVNDGEYVWIRWNDRGQSLRCIVACACGDAARVTNEKFGVDRWFRLDDLLVPPDDERAYK